jgi:two-component system, LytTR family, sensor histidine kinase LytS
MPIQWEYILSHLLLGLSLILGFVFLLTKTRMFRFSILSRKVSRREKVLYSVFFGLIGILGTYGGLATVDGSANTRGVGIIVGGLIGGPIVGVGAGIISGIYRLWIGGINAPASALAAITEGLLAGFFAERFKHLPLRWVYAMVLGFILETMHMCMLPVFSPSFERGYQLAMSIFSSMLIINPLGIATFIAILDSVRSEQEAVEGKAARMAFKIARQTLDILRRGLNEETATRTAQTIIDHVASLDAVAVTASDKGIAFVINQSSLGADFSDIACLKAQIIAPLKERDKEIGTLNFYKLRPNSLTPVEIELIEGLAQLISMQIEVSKVEQQTALRSQAEIKALQAQINPHFLFNALNTIVYYCRKQPEKARELLINLGEFYRNNISHLDKWVDLHTEIHHIESYVKIESARFQGKLEVHYDIPSDIHIKVPPFILQPIVENSIKHGLYPRKSGGTIMIQAVIQSEVLHITIKDNGVGMSEELIDKILRDDSSRKSIGLSNVHQRLQTIYGSQYGLQISSCLGKGTVVSIPIPLKGAIHELKSACSG